MSVPAALAYAEGLKVQDRSDDKVMYSLTDGRVHPYARPPPPLRAAPCRNGHQQHPAVDYKCSENVQTSDQASAGCARVARESRKPRQHAWVVRTAIVRNDMRFCLVASIFSKRLADDQAPPRSRTER